jgi:hypothetical protein
MAIVAGFDVHRAQITFDALDPETGEVERGRIPATPEAVREWTGRFAGEEVHVAVEACTGWLFVCEAQARPPLLPHAARARPRRLGTSHLTLARAVPPSPPFPDDNQSSGRLPQLSRLPPTGGGPPKTERPESFPADRPIDHHVAGHQAAHPDKPGRPRNDRNHSAPQPLAPMT